jgi:hypothetical protein
MPPASPKDESPDGSHFDTQRWRRVHWYGSGRDWGLPKRIKLHLRQFSERAVVLYPAAVHLALGGVATLPPRICSV